MVHIIDASSLLLICIFIAPEDVKLHMALDRTAQAEFRSELCEVEEPPLSFFVLSFLLRYILLHPGLFKVDLGFLSIQHERITISSRRKYHNYQLIVVLF